ncbi:hypothetical protein [Pseudonocardia hierapolitana]|nr:hypothetical protein [Pseudonocardia hierapolitana]
MHIVGGPCTRPDLCRIWADIDHVDPVAERLRRAIAASVAGAHWRR